MGRPRSILVLDERASVTYLPGLAASAVFRATGPLAAASYCARTPPDLLVIDPAVAWQRRFAESLSLPFVLGPAAG